MADQLGNAVLTLTVDDKQFNAGLGRAQAAAKNAGTAIQGAIGALGVATTAAGIAAFVGKQITELDSAAAAVRTLGVNSSDLIPRLQALSVELGNNISAVELTRAAYDVASSGFATAADATNVLRAAAVGAKGGFAEVADVASAVTGVLNAYGKTSNEAGLLVDQFIQTQADGVITVRQYAAEIGNIASIAAASGISIEELNAAIATATLRGVPVSQTFTGLRQAISSIIKPSEQAKELAQSLGIQFDVGALQAKGFGGVLSDVQAKTGGAADKIAILLGSVEAQAAVQPLLNDKLVKYNELLGRQAEAAGAAANASNTNASTISGGLQQIGNGFSNLATTLDTVLTPLFAGFIKDINNILVKLNQVSALSPDRVRQRDQEAGNIVQQAIGPFGGSGFFGSVKVKYNGKTYTGSATGVKEAILQDLLNKELAQINATTTIGANTSTPTRAAANSGVPAAYAATDVQEGEKLLQQSRQRLKDALALQGLQGAALETARQQLEIDKLRTAERKAIADYDKALSAAGFDRSNPAVINAAARMEAAGLSLKTALIEGSNALINAAKQARDQLLAAELERAKQLTSQNQGLNKFLRSDVVAQRQGEGADILKPRLKAAVDSVGGFEKLNAEAQKRYLAFMGQATKATEKITGYINGIPLKEKVAPVANDVEFAQEFISAAKADEDGKRALIEANNAVAESNRALASGAAQIAGILPGLASVIEKLAAKEWNVDVAVTGGAAAIKTF